jgi:nucleoside-diphosphate-sugar epimerase
MSKTRLVPEILNEASLEIPRQYLSCAKAREMLDWHPRYSQEEGLLETIGWYGEFLSGQQEGLKTA